MTERWDLVLSEDDATNMGYDFYGDLDGGGRGDGHGDYEGGGWGDSFAFSDEERDWAANGYGVGWGGYFGGDGEGYVNTVCVRKRPPIP